jgi:hypothetical protein
MSSLPSLRLDQHLAGKLLAARGAGDASSSSSSPPPPGPQVHEEVLRLVEVATAMPSSRPQPEGQRLRMYLPPNEVSAVAWQPASAWPWAWAWPGLLPFGAAACLADAQTDLLTWHSTSWAASTLG